MRWGTVLQWPGGSEEGTVRRGDYRKYFKGHMDQIKRDGGGAGGRGVRLGWVEGWGEKAENCN